ncbi:MAG: acyltransferase [Methylococcaceae bacterium]
MSVNNNRIFGLDALRAFAVLSVVYGHGYFLINKTVTQEIYFLPLLDGVTIFFVLSGFLIGRILLRIITNDDFHGKMLLNFWLRRWFRTLPNYFLVLIFLVISNLYIGLPQPDTLVRYFIFSQNITLPHPDFFPEAWSLAVEEWFYLIIPVPLYLFTKSKKINKRRIILLWIAIVIFLVTAFRCYRAYHFGYLTLSDWDLSLRRQVLTRLDSLMYGVLGAYISLYIPSLWHKVANMGFLLGIFILLCNKLFFSLIAFHSYSLFYYNYFVLTLDAIGTLLILPKLSVMEREIDWITKTITFVSVISYSMYLLHLSLVQLIILPVIMSKLTELHWYFAQHILLTKYIMYWVITIIGSFFLYHYFERPMTSLRDRYNTGSQAAVTAFKNHDA